MLGDSDISEDFVIGRVIDEPDTREMIRFMGDSFWDGMISQTRRRRDLGDDSDDHSKPILPFGNAGFYFLNVGALTHHVDDRHGLREGAAVSYRDHIVSNPAQIIGLAECDEELEMALENLVALKKPGKMLLKPAVADNASDFSKFAHLGFRGEGHWSVYCGARALTARKVKVKRWQRMFHVRYGNRMAYSRSLVCEICTWEQIGRIGDSLKVHVVHMHRHVAKNCWPRQLEFFWDWLAEIECDVLMGDFSLQLFAVVPELRSRGVRIDLAAWFPWKRNDGIPCADSCAIFFLNRPGQYMLIKGRSDLHDNDASGIYFSGIDAAVADADQTGFAVFTENGPGVPLGNYYGDLKAMLTPTVDEDEIEKMKQEKTLQGEGEALKNGKLCNTAT